MISKTNISRIENGDICLLSLNRNVKQLESLWQTVTVEFCYSVRQRSKDDHPYVAIDLHYSFLLSKLGAVALRKRDPFKLLYFPLNFKEHQTTRTARQKGIKMLNLI